MVAPADAPAQSGWTALGSVFARHNGVVPVEMDAEREIVEQAPDEIPPRDRRACAQPGRPRRDEPPEDQPADLLGLYDGVALTHRDSWGAPDDRRQNSAICHQPARTSA